MTHLESWKGFKTDLLSSRLQPVLTIRRIWRTFSVQSGTTRLPRQHTACRRYKWRPTHNSWETIFKKLRPGKCSNLSGVWMDGLPMVQNFHTGLHHLETSMVVLLLVLLHIRLPLILVSVYQSFQIIHYILLVSTRVHDLMKIVLRPIILHLVLQIFLLINLLLHHQLLHPLCRSTL